MGDTEIQRRGFYMTPNDGVVQPLEKTPRSIVVEKPETGERYTIRRDPFEERVADGRIKRVEPQWQPADEAVEV